MAVSPFKGGYDGRKGDNGQKRVIPGEILDGSGIKGSDGETGGDGFRRQIEPVS